MTSEQMVQCVIGTMQIEGFEVTDETRELLRKVADKEATAEKRNLLFFLSVYGSPASA